MKVTSLEQIRQDAAATAEPEAPRARPEREYRPRAIKQRFEVASLQDGRVAPISVYHAETYDEARAHAGRRALALGLDVIELWPWESLADLTVKDAVILSRLCFDELAGGELVRDPRLLLQLFPVEAQRAAWR